MERGPTGTTRSLSVLLADDDRISRLAVSHMLRRLGHRVMAAADGREAVELSGREAFDVVLMDVQMPELDGLQATAAIRRREQAARHSAGGSAHLPILAISAADAPEQIAACLASGMDGHIAKPLRSEALAAAIARVCTGNDHPVASSAQPGLEEPALDVRALLADAGDAETLARLVRIFHEQSASLRQQLGRAIEGGDVEAIQAVAQSLGDVIGHWRRGWAYQLAAQIERHASAAPAVYDVLMRALERLDDELFDVVAGLEESRAEV